MFMDGPILLVDDDPAVLEISLAALDGIGHEIVTATNGEAALAMFQAGARFSVLVTDHTMPGLQGVDLVQQAQVLQPGLPCLLVTGVGEAVEGLCDAQVLRKPYRIAHLAAVVKDLITSP